MEKIQGHPSFLIFFFWGWVAEFGCKMVMGGRGVVNKISPSPKIVLKMRSFDLKENHISTVVSEILLYTQTNILLFLSYPLSSIKLILLAAGSRSSSFFLDPNPSSSSSLSLSSSSSLGSGVGSSLY